uniref:Non-specific serine/threonine protein kinase n=1 Tax=Heterorhabditis bacteriophora TaxID=37862 RepID=A0A1I7X3Z5_HETBA
MLTGAFTKHNVDIREWIEKQLMESVLPLHPQLADLVQKYAVDSARSEKEGLSRTFVEVRKNPMKIYPSEIFTRLPIRYLLSVVEIRCNDFQTARSYLVRLSTELFPYMMPTMDSLNIARSRTLGIAIKDTVGEMNDLLMSADPSVAMKAIQKLSTAPLSDQVRLLSCVGVAFLSSLNPSTLRPFIESVTSVWSKLESVVPRMLYENSAMLWLDSSSKCDITVSDIYDYPSLLFRCDKRIFSSVAHFECFVRLVSFFEKASRTQLIRQIHCSTGQSSLAEAERMDREVLAHAFDHTQGSLIVQMLVEISDEKRMMDDPHDPCMLSTRLAIRKVACEFIHQLFIQDKNLMKLVLFQVTLIFTSKGNFCLLIIYFYLNMKDKLTLPTHMVRPLVDNVPSMFVAMDYMQEMLSLPDLNRRIFGVILMVEVARKYRITASCVTIELVLDVLHTLMKYTEVSSSLRLFLSVVPTLTQLVTIFPQLSSDVTSMLQRVSTMAKARLALSTIVCRSKSCPERRLIDMIQQCLNAELNKDFN